MTRLFAWCVGLLAAMTEACVFHTLSLSCINTTTTEGQWAHGACCEAFHKLRLEDGWGGEAVRESSAFHAIDAQAAARRTH